MSANDPSKNDGTDVEVRIPYLTETLKNVNSDAQNLSTAGGDISSMSMSISPGSKSYEDNETFSSRDERNISEVVIDMEGMEFGSEDKLVKKVNADADHDDLARADPCFPGSKNDDAQDSFELSMAAGKFDVELESTHSSSKHTENPNESSEKHIINEERCRNDLSGMKRFSPTDRMFPDVRPSSFHTVAVTLTNDYTYGDAFAPHPLRFSAKWHNDYVPLPCCPENVRKIKKRNDENIEENGEKPAFIETTVTLWSRICSALNNPLRTCDDVASAINSYCRFNGDVQILKYTTENIMSPTERKEFFDVTLPGMIDLCIHLPDILTCSIPFLCRFNNHSITLSQKQIASLLANAFFSTFPQRFGYEDDFPSINFISLLSSEGEDDPLRISSKANKLRCILNYFRRVVIEMPQGLVTYTRKSVRSSKCPDWSTSKKCLETLIPISNGTIEFDGERFLQIDFANRYVGGGVLGNGCVQEEILFVIYPELLISRLFTERLTSCEALVVTGCERFSSYQGYARTFCYNGDFIDCVPHNTKGRRCTQIVAIDALYINKHVEQFHPQKLAREINKAYVGFSNPVGTALNVPVASGKWGCGAFNGDPYLKAIIQLLAASQAGRPLILFTFGDAVLQNDLLEIYEALKSKTVGEIWQLLHQYNNLFCSRLQPKLTLYHFMTEYAVNSSDLIQLQSKEQVCGQPSVPNSTTLGNSKPIGRPVSPWLDKLAQTKSAFKCPRGGNSTTGGVHVLNENEILHALNEDSNGDRSDGCSRTCGDMSSTTDIQIEAVSNEVEIVKLEELGMSSRGRLLPGPKRPNEETGNLNAPGTQEDCDMLTLELPRQKRQMTLTDFYGSS